MVAWHGTPRAETAHHTGQTLSPVAGAKGLTAGGHAENNDFFGVVALHQIILGWGYFTGLTPQSP